MASFFANLFYHHFDPLSILFRWIILDHFNKPNRQQFSAIPPRAISSRGCCVRLQRRRFSSPPGPNNKPIPNRPWHRTPYFFIYTYFSGFGTYTKRISTIAASGHFLGHVYSNAVGGCPFHKFRSFCLSSNSKAVSISNFSPFFIATFSTTS